MSEVHAISQNSFRPDKKGLFPPIEHVHDLANLVIRLFYRSTSTAGNGTLVSYLPCVDRLLEDLKPVGGLVLLSAVGVVIESGDCRAHGVH